MQTLEQNNFEISELTDAELEAISGGRGFFSRIGHALYSAGSFVVHGFHSSGKGDVRRPTDQP
jgi:bacteriocin-like protein